MSSYAIPSTLWAWRMRSVNIWVLPHPGGASTRWNPPQAAITSCWQWSGTKVCNVSCFNEALVSNKYSEGYKAPATYNKYKRFCLNQPISRVALTHAHATMSRVSSADSLQYIQAEHAEPPVALVCTFSYIGLEQSQNAQGRHAPATV